jgi:transposase
VWVGIDVGKHAHHAAAVDGDGQLVWSRRVANDQAAIQGLIGQATASAAELCWAVDLTCSSAALLLALLVAANQPVVYVPGRTVNRMAGAFAGEAKTDPKDALVIAQTTRMRRDLLAARPRQELVAELAVLVGHRRDLMADWVRTVTRLRGLLTASFPGLERCFDFTSRSALVLIRRYQTHQGLRAVGRRRLVSWLRRHVPSQLSDARVEQMAEVALTAAAAQTIRLPAQEVIAQLVAQLANDLLGLDRRIKQLDKTITQRVSSHPQAKIICSLPGMGPLLAAELLVIVGDLSSFPDAGHLAAYGGLAPVPRDSGRRTGNLHPPKRYNRRLRRVFYLSALSSLSTPGPNRDYYQRKRAQGHRHQQALMPWPVAASMCCGHCCGTTAALSSPPPSRPQRLDTVIETPSCGWSGWARALLGGGTRPPRGSGLASGGQRLHLLSFARSPADRAGGVGEVWVRSGLVGCRGRPGWARPTWRPEARVRWVWRGSSASSPQRSAASRSAWSTWRGSRAPVATRL